MKTGFETIVKFPNGQRELGMVFSIDQGRMRVAFPGFPDIVELRSVSGFWVSETGEPFEVESLVRLDAEGEVPAAGLVARDRFSITIAKRAS